MLPEVGGAWHWNALCPFCNEMSQMQNRVGTVANIDRNRPSFRITMSCKECGMYIFLPKFFKYVNDMSISAEIICILGSGPSSQAPNGENKMKSL